MRLLYIVIFLLSFTIESFAGERILFLGDSHVPGPFGKTLNSLLRTNSEDQVETAGVCGAVASYFTKGTSTRCGYFRHSADGTFVDTLSGPAPKVQNLIPSFHPTLTIVELGANYYAWTDEGMIDDMLALAKLITASGSQCVWVTLPDSRALRDKQAMLIANTIQAIGQYCAVIDSTQMTEYPAHGGDGVHYEFPAGKPIAENWAKQVYERILKVRWQNLAASRKVFF